MVLASPVCRTNASQRRHNRQARMDPKESVMTAGASFTSKSTLSQDLIVQQLRQAFPCQSATVLLIFDHDAKYGLSQRLQRRRGSEGEPKPHIQSVTVMKRK